ncbi:uncharacterized protein BDZ83DRAFT_652854 [Colletotrichum acutatum]|uniref:Uncharacterized protein n=1 Tax=Glomerella acutata TaxID=27357 RepID=A0AAD8UI58_GLOAC|nr:uncharacterized protein BDZ83DRAFT_652854 [Colletotrichum acutatum]KAK1723633.1 hypothetical protein BDZ83DRAFT_652854 [Colletotrichum acutatum]
MASFANSRVCDAQGGLTFFKFPNELRNLIYKHYLQLDEGYKLNPHTNKLRTSNDEPIALDLMYTCKRAALEMQGFPLQHNTITFSAFHPRSRTDGINVGRFCHMMDMMNEELVAQFQQLPPRYFHSQVVKEVAAAYPAFIPVLDVMKTDHGDLGNFRISYGETPSSCRDFIRFTLNTISSHKSLFSDYDIIINEVHYNDEYYGDESPIEQPTVPPDRLFEFAPDPWAIPSQNDLDHFSYLLDPETCRLSCVSDDLYQDEETSVDPQRFRYSAVAAAVRFLDSISPILRGWIRNISLMEDQMSVCNPQCHGLGMIRFCQENPNLRIERHVKLWDTVFQKNLLHLKPEEARQPPRKVLTDEISYLIAVWVVEALALPSSGMPPDAFKLRFDGDSEGDRSCEQIFQDVLLRDAAWRAGMDECFKRGFLPQLSWREKRQTPWGGIMDAVGHTPDPDYARQHSPENRCYIFESFPQTIENLAKGSSLVACSFHPGTVWDIETLIKKRRSWSLTKWRYSWYRGKQCYVRGRLEPENSFP